MDLISEERPVNVNENDDTSPVLDTESRSPIVIYLLALLSCISGFLIGSLKLNQSNCKLKSKFC